MSNVIDPASRILAPSLRKGENVGALVERQLPALGADEELDRVDALPDGDGMALAKIVRNLGDRGFVGGAAREHHGAAADDRQQPGRAGRIRHCG